MRARVFLTGFMLLCLLVIQGGCNFHAGESEENSMLFDSIVVDKTYHLLENPENPNCNLQIKFVYPAKYTDPGILVKIQKQFVEDYFGENYSALQPKEAVDAYTNDYIVAYKDLEPEFKENLEKTNGESVGAWYSYYEMSSDVIRYNKRNLVSYTVKFENYTGGAHGSHSFNNHVIDLNTGNKVKEQDIFVENFEDELSKILVDHIAKLNNVSEAKKLEEIGFFSVDEIYPNGNFLIDETGITYTFNEYEIAAYVVGTINVHIPFDDIKYLLKADGLLASLLD